MKDVSSAPAVLSAPSPAAAERGPQSSPGGGVSNGSACYSAKGSGKTDCRRRRQEPLQHLHPKNNNNNNINNCGSRTNGHGSSNGDLHRRGVGRLYDNESDLAGEDPDEVAATAAADADDEEGGDWGTADDAGVQLVDDGHGGLPGVRDDDDTVPTRIEILLDKANVCTLVGAVLATLAMACMWQGRYYAGMCLNVAANVADIIDGPIARATPNRRRAFSVVGCKLDCYSDLVSHFVVPASLLMHMSDGNVVCTGLAAAYVCSGILRQSYFEVTGRCEGGACIYGVTSDYMVAIYVLAMHLLPFVGRSAMPFVVLVPAVGLMIAGSLTFAVRSRRYDGFGLLTVTVYNVSLCASCLALTAFETSELFELVAAGLFAVHLLLAYPCYFRFVEINS